MTNRADPAVPLPLLPAGGPPGFHLLAKPSGATCNIDCTYCFFLSKEALYPNERSRMSAATLEAYIRQLLESHRTPQVTVAWQGGEPTLMKLEFFKQAVALVEQYRRPSQTVQHTFQTNGILLDDEWCAFFKQHDFLVGLSVDGPRELHNTYRLDRIGNEGVAFTDFYAQQSCTAGRACFITGQNPLRTGLTKVGMPGAAVGLSTEDPTIAELLKPLGYATGQFGKNHLGDQNQFLPTVHGFDEFFGNLYHLNAEEEPEDPDYPKMPAFKERFGPRGVLHCWATDQDDPTEQPRWGKVGKQKIEDTGPLTKKRMETVDEEITEQAVRFIDEAHKAEKPFFIWYRPARNTSRCISTATICSRT